MRLRASRNVRGASLVESMQLKIPTHSEGTSSMVQLHNAPPPAGARLTLPSAPWFRVERHELREGPTERLVGHLSNRQWRVEGSHYGELQAHPGSTLHFEDAYGPASRELGPFQALQIADGAMYGDGKLLARFDEDTYMWRCTATREAFPCVVVAAP
jgi:hypothetical protein